MISERYKQSTRTEAKRLLNQVKKARENFEVKKAKLQQQIADLEKHLEAESKATLEHVEHTLQSIGESIEKLMSAAQTTDAQPEAETESETTDDSSAAA